MKRLIPAPRWRSIWSFSARAFETVRVKHVMTVSDFVHVLTVAQESTPGTGLSEEGCNWF
jgi:hypothetical protein